MLSLGKKLRRKQMTDRRKCRFYEHIPEENFTKIKINPLHEKDIIYCSDARGMSELPDSSVHLVVTSPPYNAGMEYEQDLTIDEYLQFLSQVWSQCYRVLVNGGRIAVNCPLMVGRVVPVPVSMYVCQSLLCAGFRFRTIFVWNKGPSAGKNTAWGSWLSASNPYSFDTSELIYVFSKGCMKRLEHGESTISKGDFLVCTTGTWEITAETNRKHPAPFPVELPRRLIEFYSFKDEVVLDPFIGSGTTAIAAMRTDRHFIGYEIKEEYVKIAKTRISIERNQKGFLF